MKAVIGKKESVATLTDYVEFDLGGVNVDFVPGQYFFVTLSPSDELHKEDLTHHFSIVNSPDQKGVLALTTRLRLKESFFKRTLNEAKAGDTVEIGKIAGSFVLPESTEQPIVMVALGIGITPFISMLRWAKEERKDYKFALIYTDGDMASMPFLEELKQMEKDWDKLKLILSVTQEPTWEGEKRRVDADFIKEYLKELDGQIHYVSGPPNAVLGVANSLKQAGVAEDNVKTDSFSGY